MPLWARRLVLGLAPPLMGQPAPKRITIRICKNCNGRIGALYENSASQLVSPMISDLAIRLTPRQQAIVGRWAIKTTLLLGVKDAIDSGSNSNPARVFLLRLNDEGALPDGSSVRIGRYPAAEPDSRTETADLIGIKMRLRGIAPDST